MKILIIGGGIFGCNIAIYLSEKGYPVELYEKKSDILLGATANNHNRLHTGAHYPRSPETIDQIIKSTYLFKDRYKESIVDNFDSYYAIAKYNSKTDTNEFKNKLNDKIHEFEEVDKINLPFKPNIVSSVYKVNENIYDVDVLRKIVKNKLKQTNVNLKLNQIFTKDNLIKNVKNTLIIDCTYGSKYYNTNTELKNYIIQKVDIPIVKMDLNPIACTIMDGNFVSFVPNGNKQNEFLLYDVLYSPADLDINKKISMIKQRFYEFYDLPKMDVIGMKTSHRIIQNDQNDQRTIKILYNGNLAEVISGKVSSVIIAEKEIFEWVKSKDLHNFSC